MNESRSTTATLDYSEQDRFASLVSRSVNRQLLVLTFALGAALGISSAINSGLAAARKLDDAFLSKQLNDLSVAVPSLDLKNLNALRAETDSATLLAIYRRLLEFGQSVFAVPEDKSSDTLSRAINARLQEFTTHDRERNDAFQIRLSLPYLSEPVSVNARQIADLWPPSLVAILAIVLGLRYQRTAFEIALSEVISQSKSTRERATRLASAEFNAGKFIPVRTRDRSFVLYRGPFILRPLPALVAFLTALVIALSVPLVLTGDPAITRPPSSIITFYYSSGVLLLLATFTAVIKSRAYYYRKASDIIGRRVAGYWAFHCTRFFKYIFGRLDYPLSKRLTVRQGLTFLTISLAVFSMFFGWIDPKAVADYSGLDFLRAQRELKIASNERSSYATQQLSEHIAQSPSKTVPQSGPSGSATAQSGRPKTPEVKTYAIPPDIFAEMRWQMYVALSFILLCVLHESVPRGMARDLVSNLRAWFAVGMTFLIMNLLLYFGVLLLQGYRSEVLQGTLDMLFGALSGHAGLPMVLFQPTPAFCLFLASCVVLVLLGPAPPSPLPALRRVFRGRKGSHLRSESRSETTD